MASPFQISVLLSISLLLLLLSSNSADADADAFLSPFDQPPPPFPPAESAPSPSPPPQERSLHHMGLLSPILENLGYQELAMAVPSLHSSPLLSAWSGPVTLFAPSDDSVRSCIHPACSPLHLLREHLAPGLFTRAYLSQLAFGTRLETASPGRCLTITSTARSGASNASAAKIFIDGVEITSPDLFNDGQIVIHGIQGFVAPLSPLSCSHATSNPSIAGVRSGSAFAGIMLRNAITRLGDGNYSILAIAMRVKYAELAGLQNMTVFALDDPSIFAGGHAYVTNVRFHVVPNLRLAHADLMRLPEGTIMPTLVHGQHLAVTHSGGAGAGGHLGGGLRINYVPIRAPDLLHNNKIVVHGIFMPFPHLYLADLASAGVKAPEVKAPEEGGTLDDPMQTPAVDGKRPCDASEDQGGCAVAPTAAPPVTATEDFVEPSL